MIDKTNIEKTNAWPFVEAKKILKERKKNIEQKAEKKKHIEFSEKIDELNQETDILLEEVDKWQM